MRLKSAKASFVSRNRAERSKAGAIYFAKDCSWTSSSLEISFAYCPRFVSKWVVLKRTRFVDSLARFSSLIKQGRELGVVEVPSAKSATGPTTYRLQVLQDQLELYQSVELIGSRGREAAAVTCPIWGLISICCFSASPEPTPTTTATLFPQER